MPDVPDSTQLLIECLEKWDNPEYQNEAESWLESHPEMRSRFAEQRAVHLALQARPGSDASHQIVRKAILTAIKEEAAPQAVKRSILAAVLAEAQGPSFPERVRRFLGLRSWAFATAVVAVVATCGLFLFWPRPSSTTSAGATAYIEAVSGNGELQSREGNVVATKQLSCRTGDQIRVGSNGAVSLVLSNGVRLQLGPESVLTIVGEADSLLLTRGLVKLTMPTQATDVGLDTAHLKIIAKRGELAVQTDAAGTHVHVPVGKARIERIGRFGTIDATNGQMVEFSANAPGAAMASVPYRRNVLDWPFSVESPWNTSVGSRAMYARIDAPGWPPASVTNAVLIRPIVVAGGTNAKVNLLAPGEAPRPIRYPEWWKPEWMPGEIVCALFPDDNLCCEMTEPIRLPSQDLRVRERNSTEMLGHGVSWSWPRARIIGGSALAGLIRRGELTFGIRHVLALAVNARAINGANGLEGHRWPGAPLAPELIAQFGDRGNLAIGALLAIPAQIDLVTLGLGTSGPGFEIAHALQDYGAYIIQTTDADFKLIAAADAGLPPNIDEIVTGLVPHLRLVSNNSARNVGGGGERRRSPAPPLLQASAPLP